MQVKSFKDIVLAGRLWHVRPIDGDGGDGGGGDDPGGGTVPTLPGLGANLRKRYTCNVAVIDEMSLVDLYNEVILPSCRGYMMQGADGRIEAHTKKPVDYAFGISAFNSGDTTIDVDNAQPWVDSQKWYIVISPHTNLSEVRQVTAAIYPASQNSTTLTSSDNAKVTVTAFSGATGGSTPATATITSNSPTASTNYTVTLNGIGITFTPGVSDTNQSIASFLAGAINAHPKLNRRFVATWNDGDAFCTITARNGTLTLNSALTNTHPAPQADPSTAPTLTAGSGGALAAGEYLVAYAYKNVQGVTLLSPFKAITVTANQKITVSTITPPAGCTVVWYVSPEANSTKLRYHSENNGASFVVDWPLPKLSAALPPGLNRTGAETMRVVAVFSDRAEPRTGLTAANVIKSTYNWKLGNRRDSINQIEFPYREAAQDFRLVTLKYKDPVSIAKLRKTNSKKFNGQAVDNYFQALRIVSALLAEYQDADFFYSWSATGIALLVEEGDVVVCTDSGSGVYNLPVMIEEINPNPSHGGLPTVGFIGQKYYSSLYDDSVNELSVPTVSEL